MRRQIMHKGLVTLAVGLFSWAAMAADTPVPIPKEGTTSSAAVFVGTMKALPLGKDAAQVSYDVTGVVVSDTAEGLLHGSSVRCVGGMFVVKGDFDNETNSCVYTRPDGDQVFATGKVTGKLGQPAKGSFTIVGGTGKLAGITGTGEFTRTSVRPLTEGGSLSYARSKASYKLP
jgi:hypothetical protein